MLSQAKVVILYVSMRLRIGRVQVARRIIIAAVGTTCFLVTAVLFVATRPQQSSNTQSQTRVVPTTIRQSAPFTIYYPSPDKLPLGYTLDKDSFSANKDTVLYSVSYDKDQKIVFTLQKKPSSADLTTFYFNQMPLRHEVQLPIGKAAIGVLNNQTMASVPSNKDSWLIVTAPLSVDQDKLEQVLQTLREE